MLIVEYVSLNLLAGCLVLTYANFLGEVNNVDVVFVSFPLSLPDEGL